MNKGLKKGAVNIKAFIITLIMLMNSFAICVTAQTLEPTVAVKFDMQLRSAEVKVVNLNAIENELVYMLVLYPEKEYSSLTASNTSEYVAYMAVGLSAENKCEFKFSLDEGTPFGRYKVMLKNERSDNWLESNFWYSDENYSTELIERITTPEGANDSEKIAYITQMLKNDNFAEALALNLSYVDDSMYEPIAKELYNEDFTASADNFNKVFYSAVISLNMQKDGSVEDKRQIISELETYTGLNESKIYPLYSQNVYQEDLFNMLKENTSLSYNGLCDAIAVASVNAELNNILRWESVVSILEKYDELLNTESKKLDFEGYEKLVRKSEMVASFLEKDRADLADIVDDFNQCVLDYVEVDDPPSSSGGSSYKGNHTMSFGGSSAVVPSVKEEEISFLDVSKNHWAYEAIKELSSRKILTGMGDGNFVPDNTLTRAQLVKIVVTAFGLDSSQKSVSFKDVETSDWYYDYVAVATAAGIVNGKSEDIFDPDAPVTREEMATILYRALNGKGVKLETEGQNEKEFKDKRNIALYALESVLKLSQCGIISGFTDGEFKPAEITTRAQCANIVYKALKTSETGGAK